MNIKWKVRILIYTIGILFALIVRQQIAHGAEWPTNYQQYSVIRDLARDLPKGTELCFVLNDGRLVFGKLIKYEVYNDYIWYQPDGTGHNWFKQDAFDVHEIFRINVINKEPV